MKLNKEKMFVVKNPFNHFINPNPRSDKQISLHRAYR